MENSKARDDAVVYLACIVDKEFRHYYFSHFKKHGNSDKS